MAITLLTPDFPRIGSSYVAPPEPVRVPCPHQHFTETYPTPLQRGRVSAALAQLRRFDGTVSTIGAEIVRRVAAGAVVDTHPKWGRRLVSVDGGWLDQPAVTKIGLDYAEFLIAVR